MKYSKAIALAESVGELRKRAVTVVSLWKANRVLSPQFHDSIAQLDKALGQVPSDRAVSLTGENETLRSSLKATQLLLDHQVQETNKVRSKLILCDIKIIEALQKIKSLEDPQIESRALNPDRLHETELGISTLGDETT